MLKLQKKFYRTCPIFAPSFMLTKNFPRLKNFRAKPVLLPKILSSKGIFYCKSNKKLGDKDEPEKIFNLRGSCNYDKLADG